MTTIHLIIQRKCDYVRDTGKIPDTIILGIDVYYMIKGEIELLYGRKSKIPGVKSINSLMGMNVKITRKDRQSITFGEDITCES
jgi:hypothetical protein